jgi:hypothetical protein
MHDAGLYHRRVANVEEESLLICLEPCYTLQYDNGLLAIVKV